MRVLRARVCTGAHVLMMPRPQHHFVTPEKQIPILSFGAVEISHNRWIWVTCFKSRGHWVPGVSSSRGRVLPSLRDSQVSLGGKPARKQVRLPRIEWLHQPNDQGQSLYQGTALPF